MDSSFDIANQPSLVSSESRGSKMVYCYRRNESQVLQLLTNLGKLFKDQSLFDCSIVCEGDKIIKGHKLMLAASSEYFASAFKSFDNQIAAGSINSCTNTAIIIREIPYEDLKLIIDYIYSGTMIIPSEQLTSLQRSCQWLKVNCLPKSLITPSTKVKSTGTGLFTKINANVISKSKIKGNNESVNCKNNKVSKLIIRSNGLPTADETLTNGHGKRTVNTITSANRVPSLLYSNASRLSSSSSSSSSSVVNHLLKIVDPLQLLKSPSSADCSSSTLGSSLNLKIISSPNDVNRKRLVSSLSSSSSSPANEPFVQLRELLNRREPTHLIIGGGGGSGDESECKKSEINGTIGNGNEPMKSDTEVGGRVGEEQDSDQKRVNDNDDGDDDKNENGKKRKIIREEKIKEGGGGREDDQKKKENEIEMTFRRVNEVDDNDQDRVQDQGQRVDNTGYLSSEEFEIDIPRSNEDKCDLEIEEEEEGGEEMSYSHHRHHLRDDELKSKRNALSDEIQVEIEEEEEEEEEDDDEMESGEMEDERIGGEEEVDDDEMMEGEDEDEVIDMRVNNGRRFDGHSQHQLNSSSVSYNHPHRSNAYQTEQNLEVAAAVAAVAAAAAAAAAAASKAPTTSSSSSTGLGLSTTDGSNAILSNHCIDECPSSDSLDLDCGDKLRATNYSMIPFTASIASSFTSATARAIAASTTLAVASGLLSKQQQSSSSSQSNMNRIHSSLHLHPNTLQSLHRQQHQQHNHHSHDLIYKTINSTTSNCDSITDSISTVPLKRGRGRPPRHLRETPITVNGSSTSTSSSSSSSSNSITTTTATSTSSSSSTATTTTNTTSSTLEPSSRSTYKMRNILPLGTSSDLLIKHNLTNKPNHTNNQLEINGNHINDVNQLILSSSSSSALTSNNLGLTLKRANKIRVNNNNGNFGIVGLVTSTKGRKPKLSIDCLNGTITSGNSTNNGKNVCPYCPQVYYSNQAMNDHINNVHTGNSRKYTCDLCSKEFSWKISLTKHLRNSHKPNDKLSTTSSTESDLVDSRQLTLTM